MTDTIGTYSFLPWARQGLGTRIQDASTGIRASVPVTLSITADLIAGGQSTENLPRHVQLYGPGDVIGVDADAVVRTDPRHLVTNFETNYLPYIEFYEEDFPWRYTPAAPSAGDSRVAPWLTLAVLAEGEFTMASTSSARPLPAIDVTNPADVLPTHATLWAWGHVHVNAALGGTRTDSVGNAASLAAIVADNRDRAYSRLLSPRILRANTAYHAFLIPSFEAGRLAGIGRDPAAATSPTQPAWAVERTSADDRLFPVYYRWYFRTGEVGDFEYLVRLLEPRTVDPQVGRRPMDTLKPGSNLPSIPELGGILRLGGALRAPSSTLSDADLAEYLRFEKWASPGPHTFQTALSSLINLAADYSEQTPATANSASGIAGVSGNQDPLIVPPLYGRWHAQVMRLTPANADPDASHWVDELNLDPRHRVAAGLGTGVVQRNQESYMESAWLQVGKVLAANARIRFGHMAMLTSLVWHRRRLGHFVGTDDEGLLSITAPVHRRVLTGASTIAHAVKTSLVPPVLVSTSLRKTLRPRARVVRLGALSSATEGRGLLTRVNAGVISAAPPKQVPSALPVGAVIASKIKEGASDTDTLPTAVRDFLLRFPSWRMWLIVLTVLLAVLLALVPVVGIVLAVLALVGGWFLVRWLESEIAQAGRGSIEEAAASLDDQTRTPESVDSLPTSESFTVDPPIVAGPNPPVITLPAAVVAGPDSATAVRFKQALRLTYSVDAMERRIPVVVRAPLDIAKATSSAYAGIDPTVTVPRLVRSRIDVPARIAGELVDDFGEVMVYPEIDDPMYAPLMGISNESFLPNIQLLAMNSITLLETNQKFIESYMVGVNHEFARELLWREYPTDQRGSYMRQFWDPSGFLPEPGSTPAAVRERLFDIPELHRWSRESALGDHDNREINGDKEDELVLTVRGELLKKYPTAVIYAHRAEWQLTRGAIDKSKPRLLKDLVAGSPTKDTVKTPLYEAKVAPDIYFFGFDLTADVARGGSIVDGEEDPGWFFVIKERPGEPRFGLDLPQDTPHGPLNTWNQLSWTDAVEHYDTAKRLEIPTGDLTVSSVGLDAENTAQHNDDVEYHWRSATHAAEIAYVLFQLPALMAVHAADMLRKGE